MTAKKILKKGLVRLTDWMESDRLHLMDFLVAVVAVGYVMSPYELIPDTVQYVGYLDDSLVLCVAATYYIKRVSALIGKKKSKPSLPPPGPSTSSQ